MAGDASAYAALGLEPGADAAAVEQAYRRLIKQHHPDREGGDSARAAEINRAYHELKAGRSPQEPIQVHQDVAAIARPRWAWTAIALVLLIALMSLPLLSDQPLLPPLQFGAAGIGPQRVPSRASTVATDAMDQPLHLAAIDGSARHARELSRTGDEMALANASGDCHRALRTDPSVLQFDRCAAFDDAVIQLEDRDPLRDQGPFSEIAVTGRIWSGATALSDDSLAIDGRLGRIRQRVQFSLAPAAVPQAPGKN